MIKRSLTAVAACGALLLSGTTAFAQTAPDAPITPPGAPAGHGHHRANKMRAALQSLGLSADQKQQIASDMKAFRAARQSGTPETRADMMSKVESALTPDQRTRFESAMAKPAAPAQTAPAPQ